MGLNPRGIATLLSVSVMSIMILGLPDFDRRDYRRLYDRVKVGMTVEQVEAITGRSDDLTPMEDLMTASYANDQLFPGLFSRDRKELMVVFRDGRVMHVTLSLGGLSQSKPELEPAPSR